MVSFMVLAFVGAGVFTMKMRWLLGYLGTTLDSWVVATLGFNGYEVVSYPAVCAGVLLILFGSQNL
jgi:phosphate:Na+ symporter